MSDFQKKDRYCILSITEAIEKIDYYINPFNNHDDFYSEQKTFDAVLMNFVVIGEMTVKLSEKFFRESAGEIDWYKIKSFRNIIAHNYFGVDAEEVWQIIQNDLPDLKKKLHKFLTEV